MADAHDVARYILKKQGAMSTWKLQKLVYYSQAWHLAWDNEPLFDDAIEAWANGPVVKTLYNKHRGQFTIKAWGSGSISNLTKDQREAIDAVLTGYGSLTGRQLSLLTHNEAPWRETREGLPPTARSQRRIKPELMLQFYSALDADPDAMTVEELDWTALGDG